MRAIQIVAGSIFVLAVSYAQPVLAENWVDMGTNSAIRPELQAAFGFCVDMYSVKASKSGWTSYDWKLCSEPREVFEDLIRCNQDFSAEQVTMRSRALVKNGKPQPKLPWKTDATYVSSMGGKIAQFICHK